MARPMFTRACSLALLLGLVSASAFDPERAVAQENGDALVVVRAVGADVPSERVVRLIAANAEPRRFERENNPEIARLTPLAVIEQLCGSVPEGYVQQFQVMNGAGAPPLTEVLGDGAYEVQFPACLYVEPNSDGRLNFRTVEGDSATEIRTGFTGAAPEREGLPEFLGFGAILDDRLPTGTLVQPAFGSDPTLLRIRREALESFAATLQHVSRGSVQTNGNDQGGYIFPPLSTQTVGAVHCDARADDYPYRPRAVRAAFVRTRDRIARAPDGAVRQEVYLYVVDNGFFGVPCAAGNCPIEDERGRRYSEIFPRRFFDGRNYPNDTLGPVIQETAPINYGHELAVNEITAHGTHVAGLALGGPLFSDAEYRDAVFEPGANWLRLVIASLGRGEQHFRGGADIVMFTALEPSTDARMVVNLSLGVDEATRGRIGVEMRRRILAVRYKNALFVVAAGNGYSDLNDLYLYPARLGGIGGARNSVLTVASVEANGAVSEFSNFGNYVDIAAPGCQISSWFNIEEPPQPLSGTSQAAPLVSWTAAMLRSYWDVAPAGIKARLIYSGSLIADPAQRAKIYYGVELDIPRALMISDDLLSVRVGRDVRTFVGQIQPIQGLSCQTNAVQARTIRSYKRNGAFQRLYYMDFDDDVLQICDAHYNAPALGPIPIPFLPAPIQMEATHELVDGVVTPLRQPTSVHARMDAVVDIVFANVVGAN